MNDIPGADARRREQERIRKEYPDLYYYAVGVALVVVLMIAGYALFPDRDGYLTNLFTEAASVAVTLLVLNRMAEAREKRQRKGQLKQDLIYRMRSRVNDEAVRAVEELALYGWLFDGTLSRVFLEGANLEKAPLWRANLERAAAWGVNLKQADLESAILVKARLRETVLEEANLSRAYLQGADLDSANLKKASLDYANLAGGVLDGADLRGACLMQTCLSGASIKDANLTQTVLWGANLEGADFEGATLPNGDKWHPGYDMSIFTDPSDGSKKEQPITDHQTEDASRPPTSPLPPGTPGEVLLQRIHKFDFTPEDLEEMSRAIEEDCERIDPESFSDSAT